VDVYLDASYNLVSLDGDSDENDGRRRRRTGEVSPSEWAPRAGVIEVESFSSTARERGLR
jgi:hypothetical protein